MKAVYIERFGGPEVLTYGDVPDPVPAEDEILIDVAAASVNVMRLTVGSEAAPRRAPSADRTSSSLRSLRQRTTASTAEASTAGSTRRIPPSSPS